MKGEWPTLSGLDAHLDFHSFASFPHRKTAPFDNAPSPPPNSILNQDAAGAGDVGGCLLRKLAVV